MTRHVAQLPLGLRGSRSSSSSRSSRSKQDAHVGSSRTAWSSSSTSSRRSSTTMTRQRSSSRTRAAAARLRASPNASKKCWSTRDAPRNPSRHPSLFSRLSSSSATSRSGAPITNNEALRGLSSVASSIWSSLRLASQLRTGTPRHGAWSCHRGGSLARTKQAASIAMSSVTQGDLWRETRRLSSCEDFRRARICEPAVLLGQSCFACWYLLYHGTLESSP